MEESEQSGLSEKNIAGSPKGKEHEGVNLIGESQNSAKLSGFSHEDLVEPRYYSDASSGSRKPNNQGGNSAPQHLDQDRAELLRKIDEIKEQLIRNPNLMDKPKEPNQTPSPFFGPSGSGHVPGPYYQHHLEPFPFASPHQIPMHGLHTSRSNPSRMPGYGDPFGFQTHRRPPPYFFSGQSPRQPFFSGQSVDIGSDIFETHSQDSMFRPYFPAPPSHLSDVPYSPASYHHERMAPLSPHNYNDPRSSIPSPRYSSGPQTHQRWQNEVDSEMGVGGFTRQNAPKAVLPSGARRCHPLAGGAPFLACHNCFEVLRLSKKVLKKQQKLKCGSCSELISFSIVSNKLVLSNGNEDTNPVTREVDANSPVVGAKDSTISSSSPHVTRSSGNFSSVDYDNSGYDFRSMDGEPVEGPKPHNVQSSHSSSSYDRSDHEKDVHSLKAHEEVVQSVPRTIKDGKPTSPPTGSSLQELFEYSTANREALLYGIANLSFGSENEFMTRNSRREDFATSQTEVSFNEYTNSKVSQDSKDERRREDDRRRGKKGIDRGSVNIFKRSFRSENEEKDKYEEVWVNGHLIQEDLVKDAEKLAGPIQPGNYWYDYRAGFWGVMGYPCLGIIMPFIEEFNYKMQEKCADGDTGVFVNGRELHQKDLDLLVERGLPNDKNRCYIVDISGRVLDGDTGEELDSLGRLAPTIEKVKHGFGMRVPRALFSS